METDMIVAGGDLDVVTTQDWIDKSTTALGTKPLFWGRYFKGPGNTDPTQYQPNSENALIKENNIKILPTS